MKKSTAEFYGGFWQRFGSTFIDGIFITAVSTGINFALGVSSIPTNPPAAPSSNTIYAFLFSLVAGFVYFSLFQGWFKGSIGKHIMGLTLVDAQDFEQVSIGQSVGRYFMSFLSTVCLFAGYFAVGFSDKKQAWHDRVAGTVVVKKSCLHKLKNDGVYESYKQAA